MVSSFAPPGLLIPLGWMGNDLTSTCEPPKLCLREISIVAAGVLEYWIIDPLEGAATFLVREGDAFVERLPRDAEPPPFIRGDKEGSAALNPRDSGPQPCIYRSRVLPGFELDVRWLWQRPLLATMPIVRRLLGEK